MELQDPRRQSLDSQPQHLARSSMINQPGAFQGFESNPIFENSETFTQLMTLMEWAGHLVGPLDAVSKF